MRILRWPELHKNIGLSRTQIWRLEKSGDFPSRIQLSANSIGWDANEIQNWLQSRKRVSNPS